MAAAESGAAMAANSINLVDENNAGSVFLALLEEIAHAAGADADEHLDEIGARNREERDICFAGNRAREQSLSCSRRANQQHALRNAPAELLEFLRILQEVDDFVQLFLGLVDSGHVLECGF